MTMHDAQGCFDHLTSSIRDTPAPKDIDKF